MIPRMAAALSACILFAFATTYYLTYEPAPQVRIKWRDGLAPTRKAVLERQFLLVNPKPFEDRLTYDLLDTSRENLIDVVNERDIQDTDNISRENFSIPPQIPYGDSWMWAGDRLPVLRTPGVATSIVRLSGIVLAVSAGMLIRERLIKARHSST